MRGWAVTVLAPKSFLVNRVVIDRRQSYSPPTKAITPGFVDSGEGQPAAPVDTSPVEYFVL